MIFFTMLVPMILAFVALYASLHQVDFYAAFLKGAKEGLLLMTSILPALVGLLTAISMVKASTALDLLANLPCFAFLQGELLPLMLIRPLSGSAALSVAADIMASHGPDSFLGRCASVMLGSTETTFYTITLYFASCGISKTRYAIPAALLADFTGFFLASLTVQYFFYR